MSRARDIATGLLGLFAITIWALFAIGVALLPAAAVLYLVGAI